MGNSIDLSKYRQGQTKERKRKKKKKKADQVGLHNIISYRSIKKITITMNVTPALDQQTKYQKIQNMA